MELDDIHRAHGKASTVNHATNAAIQRHIIEFPLRGMRLSLVLLRRVMHRLQFGLAIQCVGIHNDFGIEAMQIAFIRNDQRIDLNQREVFVGKELCQA